MKKKELDLDQSGKGPVSVSKEAMRLLEEHRKVYHLDFPSLCTICFSLRRAMMRGAM